MTIGCFHLHKGQLFLSKLGRVLINQPSTPRASPTINPYPYVPVPLTHTFLYLRLSLAVISEVLLTPEKVNTHPRHEDDSQGHQVEFPGLRPTCITVPGQGRTASLDFIWDPFQCCPLNINAMWGQSTSVVGCTVHCGILTELLASSYQMPVAAWLVTH